MCVPKAVPRKARWPDCTCVAAPGRQPPRACRARVCIRNARSLKLGQSVTTTLLPTEHMVHTHKLWVTGQM